MKIAVSSQGNSLDAWASGPFGTCSQFVVVDAKSMDVLLISVPPDQMDPSRASLYAIRALANQGVEVVITGSIKDICKQTMISLGIEVVDGVERMTVREAIELYKSQGTEAVRASEPSPVKIAVASHGDDLDAALSQKEEPCTSFVLVDPQTMAFEVVRVEAGASPEQTSVNAVRAAARSGATVVITPQIRPACCTALRALAIVVALADTEMTDKGVTSLEDLLQIAIDLDVHLLACSMSMGVMEITHEDLIDEVEDVVGVATFVKDAANSAIQLFI